MVYEIPYCLLVLPPLPPTLQNWKIICCYMPNVQLRLSNQQRHQSQYWVQGLKSPIYLVPGRRFSGIADIICNTLYQRPGYLFLFAVYCSAYYWFIYAYLQTKPYLWRAWHDEKDSPAFGA